MQIKDRQNIVLTGFMATGGTTVGKLLAERLNREFIDTDELIQARQGKSIPEIFKEMGEVFFREMEADIAKELGRRENLDVELLLKAMESDNKRVGGIP